MLLLKLVKLIFFISFRNVYKQSVSVAHLVVRIPHRLTVLTTAAMCSNVTFDPLLYVIRSLPLLSLRLPCLSLYLDQWQKYDMTEYL